MLPPPTLSVDGQAPYASSQAPVQGSHASELYGAQIQSDMIDC
jgi:hypothetical protein